MKKIAVAGFAVLYAFLILSATAERATEAVSVVPGHFGSTQHDASSGKFKRAETRLTQTKINEPGFVVELSREAAVVPILSEHLTLVSTFEFRSDWSRPSFSSRAPPFLI